MKDQKIYSVHLMSTIETTLSGVVPVTLMPSCFVGSSLSTCEAFIDASMNYVDGYYYWAISTKPLDQNPDSIIGGAKEYNTTLYYDSYGERLEAEPVLTC